MEIQIGTDEFSRALYRAQGIVEKKSTMPILASVLLEASEDGGGRLKVSAFDLEIGVTGTHPCEVRKAGSVALKHKELYDIVRALPEKSLVLKRSPSTQGPCSILSSISAKLSAMVCGTLAFIASSAGVSDSSTQR